ncbi:MAG: leucine-rich repeat domain-containing protein [Eubacteriales bacterium]|nr:leucine-rich repeat domain-containing protein [Eubacteriales bacterium]
MKRRIEGSRSFTNMFHEDMVHGFVPEGTKELAAEAFSNFESLETVHLPDGLEGIGERAFFGCNRLREISLPASLKHIGRAAFYYCRRLRSLSVPSGIERIADETFLECNLSRIVFSDNLKHIGRLAFAYNNLKEIRIPKTVETLDHGAFYRCKHLIVYDTLQDGLQYAGHNLHPGLATGLPWGGHRVTVLDAATGALKYTFYVAGSLWTPARQEMMELYDGASIDFAHYDALFERVRAAEDRVSIALLRLTHPFELSEAARSTYIDDLHAHAKTALEQVVFDKNYALLKLCSEIGLLTCDNVDYFIHYASERPDNVEIRTFLLNFKNEHCQRGRMDLFL